MPRAKKNARQAAPEVLAQEESRERQLAERVARLTEELAAARQKIASLEEQLAAAQRICVEGQLASSKMAELREELRAKTFRIQKELEIAREFQRRLMPLHLPKVKGIRLAALYQPTEKVGGDLYDVFEMENNCIGVLIADVSGHGLPAAFLTTMVKMAFNAFRSNRHSPRAIMEEVNRDLCANTLETQFATAFFAILDCGTLRLKFVNASHCCPILYSPTRFEMLDTEGHFLGMFEDPRYREKEISLKQGDRIFFYTDGLPEAFNREGKAYGMNRVLDLVRANRDADVQTLIERASADLAAHLEGLPAEDDVTLLGLEVVREPMAEERLEIPTDPMQISRVEEIVIPALERLNYGERAIFAVRLALEEAIINAMKHGNHMDRTKKVTIAFTADEKEARISVADEGDGFDPKAVPDPTLDENLEVPHGRGLLLMRAYMDEVVFNEKGNQVTMIKRAPWR